MKAFQFMRNSLIRRFVQCSLLLSGPISAPSGDVLAGESQTLVVPLNNATTPGQGAQDPFSADGARYLSIYSPSQFIAAMPEGGRINRIAFRLDETVRGRSVSFDFEAEVRMSTSASLTTTIPSPRFSENVGKDQTIVLPRQNIHWDSKTTTVGANPFDLVLELETGFLYDPRQGSLAIDLLTFRTPAGNIRLDTEGANPSGTTEIALVGSQQLDIGLFLHAPVVRIQYSSIPEPPTCAIVLFGLVVFLGKGRR